MPDVTQTATDHETTDENTGNAPPARGNDDNTTNSRKRYWLIGGAALLTAAVTATALLTGHEGDTTPPPYTVPVTYDVTGEGHADIAYNTGTGPNAPAGEANAAELPWSKNVSITPDSGPASVTIVLGGKGGQATCALTIHGKHVQRATASGPFGRATCAADVPEQEQ